MTLYVCATPIGNLGDASPRLVETLRGADVIACEDTRHTLKLLSHFGIRGPRLVSLHEHNEEQRVAEMLALLREGALVALVSDAGMPTLSDPGYRLIRACHAEGMTVASIPGPSAVTAALSLSGLPSDRALFSGFLPRGRRELEKLLAEAAGVRATLVAFESPRRVRASLAALQDLAPQAEVALCREISKLHEQVLTGTPGQVALALEDPVRGEIVLVVAVTVAPGVALSKPDAERDAAEVEGFVQGELQNGGKTRDVARMVAERTGMGHSAAYELVLAVKARAAEGAGS